MQFKKRVTISQSIEIVTNLIKYPDVYIILFNF